MPKRKKINVIALAKVHAIVFGGLGVIAGILYSFGGLIIDALTTGLNKGTALAFLALVGMPGLFLTVGFLAGLLIAVIYNIISALWGGIEIDFKP